MERQHEEVWKTGAACPARGARVSLDVMRRVLDLDTPVSRLFTSSFSAQCDRWGLMAHELGFGITALI